MANFSADEYFLDIGYIHGDIVLHLTTQNNQYIEMQIPLST